MVQWTLRGLVAVCLISSLGHPAPALALQSSDWDWLDQPPPTPQQQPFVAIETFPLPTARVDSLTAQRLAFEAGVAGTDMVGLRLRLGLPTGYSFESVEVAIADGRFLADERSLWSAVTSVLARFARFLLFGRLVSAGAGFEVPAAAWASLLDASPIRAEPVALHSKREVKLNRDARAVSHHGAFVVCRLLVAANPLTELVDIRIRARNYRTGELVRYHVPRLKLPAPEPVPDAPNLRTKARLAGTAWGLRPYRVDG